MIRTILPGRPFPQGATWDGTGTNFALFSENAAKVELCLFDDPCSEETQRVELIEQTAHVWHAFLPGVHPGQIYGYRVYGLFDPERGLRFNPNKLLIDPYAKALAGKVNWNEPIFPYPLGNGDADLMVDASDSVRGMPKCVVVNPYFDWDTDRPPKTPLSESIIYEVHVKGFTKCHPEIPEELRGTYAGLASRPAVEYLKKLGITAVELMPVHDFLDDKILIDRGLRNYWGYNTTNFFSPDARYSSSGDTGGQVAEFKAMVKTLHREGIEVILDVVYNHTSEGNHLGPMLSFRGIDNPTYYRLVPDNPRYYMDYTGTGNSLNMRHPQVLKLIMDNLRYWILEMHVDGFRFDLAATLARELHDVDRLSAFFDIIHQDPVISQVKLIAEPWDVGEGGYQVGKFPVLWAEWNGKYRDTVRRYWKSDEGQLSDLGYRLTGSSDLYQRDGRRPSASINFVTAHDGFTLHDLVSYNEKHNEANGEENRDGANENYSWNFGVEGDTDDPVVLTLRERQKRNFLSTLLLSQGVPMICGGDEIDRDQKGNNNAYCQDNPLTWYDWNLSESRQSLLRFTQKLIALRRSHPNLRRRKFYQDRAIRGTPQKDIVWLRTDATEMTDEEWNAGWVRCIGMMLNGHTLQEVDESGLPVIDNSFLLLLNCHHEHIDFRVPAPPNGGTWSVVIDTNEPDLEPGSTRPASGGLLRLVRQSLLLLREEEPPPMSAPGK
ncbi:MAG TPA: glycogen debranching protein GlgX [Bryobacteraceae bacterium]|jgi:isoamylase|nr:glycogen debranching protein GlgX [Bryobacteraceae bacterium]